MSLNVRLTIADLELFPEPIDDTRYELIDGELHVSTQPEPHHQITATLHTFALTSWSRREGGGTVIFAPGIIFSTESAVAPDVVWFAPGRFEVADDRKLHVTPDLVVEVLSPGSKNERRDHEIKLVLYGRFGVREYWIVDWRTQSVLVYRHDGDGLRLAASLGAEDTLTSPILPGFSVPLRDLFPHPA